MRISIKLATLALAGIVLTFAPLRAQTNPQRQGMPAASQDSRSQTQTWSGTLADADCKAATPTEKCEVTDLTRNFGLETTAGKFMHLDNPGMKKSTLLSRTPNKRPA